jgi:type IV pilus assembly protein PilA
MKQPSRGFSLIELMVVIVVIGTLAAMAYPSFQFRIIRQQIESVTPLTDLAKRPVEAAWANKLPLPADNFAAALPVPEKMVSNFVKSVKLDNGVVNVTFGNQANGVLKDKVLSMRPAVVTDAPMVPVAWICAGANVPDKMTVQGVDRTTVPVAMLPPSCRKREVKK